ncbi:sodium/hydrogen exchanger 3 [Pilobolus umbonatus]|nr:sodium/hydrogen exchanger 3 [Pilobolus umbonatus]
MIVGLVIKLAPGTIIQDMMKFKEGLFFNLLLPPIILNSGYELKRRNFFWNFGTILIFAMLGTLIAAVVTGVCTFLYAYLHPEGIHISFLDSMIFGSILSATDPVTILAIFNQLNVDPQLFSIISGESLLNDAVAIVLSDTLRKFRGQDLHISNILKGIGLFMGVFWASTFIGVLYGVLVALILKHSQLYRFPHIETSIVLLMAYSSYFFSNATQMSGIVTLLFTGIILKHYAYDNLSLKSKRATKSVFQILSQLSENFIFIYLGINLFAQDDLEYKPLFILVTLGFISIARYASVTPLSAIINAVCRALGKPEQLPYNHQMMLFWAGLRGAVAFALASGITGDSAPAMRTTILAVVVLTVLLFGGTTSRMLQVLGIRTGVIEPEETSENEEEEDSAYPSNSIQLNNDSQDNLLTALDADEDDLLLETGQSQRPIDGPDVSIGGLLSGPLGEPILGDRPPHWFVSFDDKWLKPFLTKRHIQERNMTLAEYWRDKRRTMERSNRKMLAGIRNLNLDENNNEQMNLKPVKKKSTPSTGTSSRAIYGAGRVFGRSPSLQE